MSIYTRFESNSPLCAENEDIADINHSIFSCEKTREKTNGKLIQLPVNIQALLTSDNKNVCILVEHIFKNDTLI